MTSPPETTAFGPITVAHDADVLTPRPWTLVQAQWAAAVLRGSPPGPVLELGCGAGQIGLAIAAWTGRSIVQVDASQLACDLARRNADAAGIASEVRNADLSSALHRGERFVLITADPPYVPTGRVNAFPEDPPASIDGGSDGLDVARQCVALAERHLVPGGTLLIQLCDAAQARALGAEINSSSPLEVHATWEIADTGALLLARALQAAPG